MQALRRKKIRTHHATLNPLSILLAIIIKCRLYCGQTALTPQLILGTISKIAQNLRRGSGILLTSVPLPSFMRDRGQAAKPGGKVLQPHDRIPLGWGNMASTWAAETFSFNTMSFPLNSLSLSRLPLSQVKPPSKILLLQYSLYGCG